MLTEYIGKILSTETKPYHVVMIGCQRKSGDYYQCCKPSKGFVFKPLVLNEQLIERGYKYLDEKEVADFFRQK